MATCSACTLVNPPGALVCEACSALLGGCDDCDKVDQPPLLVVARRLWDGLSDTCVEGDCGVCVAVVDGRIKFAGLVEHLPEHLRVPAEVYFGDADTTLMPGLIDSHVHIEFDPLHGLHTQPRMSEEALMNAMRTRARHMLAHGITVTGCSATTSPHEPCTRDTASAPPSSSQVKSSQVTALVPPFMHARHVHSMLRRRGCRCACCGVRPRATWVAMAAPSHCVQPSAPAPVSAHGYCAQASPSHDHVDVRCQLT
jgi:hypothetical protein